MPPKKRAASVKKGKRRDAAPPKPSINEKEIQAFKDTLKPAQVPWPIQAYVPPDAGPRPDEELLNAVRIEAPLRSELSVERVYEVVRDPEEEVNQRTVDGYTPLIVAAAHGNAPLVSLLLERRADVAVASLSKNELPIHFAARSGNRVVCQLLAEQCEPLGLCDVPNTTGWPPLHLAAAGGHQTALAVLVRHGADINSRNMASGGYAALHLAVRMGHVDAVEALLDYEADVHCTDSVGREPLAWAAERGDLPLVSLLLRSKADPSRRTPGGQTPKDMVPEGHPKVVNLLAAYMRPPAEPPRTDLRFDLL